MPLAQDQTAVHVSASPPPAAAVAPASYTEVASPVVEVAPAEVPPRTNGFAGVNSSTVVEVLPPDPRTLPAKTNGRTAAYPPRVRNEAPLKSVLFNNQRQAEAEYDHARRAKHLLRSVINGSLELDYPLPSGSVHRRFSKGQQGSSQPAAHLRWMCTFDST